MRNSGGLKIPESERKKNPDQIYLGLEFRSKALEHGLLLGISRVCRGFLQHCGLVSRSLLVLLLLQTV